MLTSAFHLFVSLTTLFIPGASIVSVELGGDAVLPCSDNARICRLTPPAGPTALASGKSMVATAYSINSSHCVCKMPPVDAAVPFDVEFLSGDAEAEKSHSRFGLAGRVDYVAMWMPSLSRRPYVSSDTHAAVLVKSHPALHGAKIVIFGADGRAVLPPTPINPGLAESISFSLSSFPSQVIEKLNATLISPTRRHLPTRILLLERVGPPKVSLFSQVDYSRKALLVNGDPFIVQGFYDMRPVGNRSQIDALLPDYEMQKRLGFNVVLQYLNWRPTEVPDSTILYMLDCLHDRGLLIMFNIFHLVQNLTGQGNSSSVWSLVTQKMDLVRNHPALLGWYICDDCMSSYLSRQLSSKTPTIDNVYRALRAYDPWHITIGAIESEDLYVFTQPNIFVPGPSLDVTMVENYVGTLSANAQLGGAASPGNDGGLRRWPMTWEPVINCVGNYVVKRRQELTDKDQANIVYGLLWLAAVTADITGQLTFRRSYCDKLQMQAIGRYNLMIQRFSQFFAQPPSALLEPGVSAWSRPTPSGTCTQCSRLWRLQQLTFCALLVVVNTDEMQVNATVQLDDSAGLWPLANIDVTPIDPIGHAFSAVDGRFFIAMDANATNIYQLGCHEDPFFV